MYSHLYIKIKTLSATILLLLVGGCAAIGAISAYSSWQGHPIEEFIARQGQPSQSSKQLFSKGHKYTWQACGNTGRVITYQQNIGGPYYSQAEQACTACTAYTDEHNAITAITGRCP